MSEITNIIKAACSKPLESLGFLFSEEHAEINAVYFFSEVHTLCIAQGDGLYTAAFFTDETADRPDGCSAPDLEELVEDLRRVFAENGMLAM